MLKLFFPHQTKNVLGSVEYFSIIKENLYIIIKASIATIINTK